MKKNKAFTLIELVAVLVILAILALIVTPLVMNIIRKARISADKRSIDAYGRSIEIAIAGYLLDNGTFPTSIGQLTIEYSGDEVVCSTTQLNGDSSVYLTGCTVGGRSVDYAYGSDLTPSAPTYTAYSVGDEVSYNNVDYYVIANSGTNESTVTLLKAHPLTTSEVNTYGSGHVNMYVHPSSSTYQIARDYNGYGGVVYYSSETCGYDGSKGDWVFSDCGVSYSSSEIKYVIDTWKNTQAPLAIEARLITLEEYKAQCEAEEYYASPSNLSTRYVPQYDWMYNNDYNYWTSSPYDDSMVQVFYIGEDGRFDIAAVVDDGGGSHYAVRPVITLSKSLISA